jgi:hypothetical protein
MKIRLGIGVECIHSQSGIVFDTDYQAILSNGTTRGVTLPSDAEQLIQNQLILNLKSADIWSKLDAFYVFANNITDSTGGFARINWKNPSANYCTAAPNLPTITAKSGFVGGTGGSNLGLSLNLAANAGSNFLTSSASYGVFIGTMGGGNNRIMGASGNTTVLNRIRKGTCAIVGKSSGTITITSGVGNSFYHLNANLTEARMYVNGAAGTSDGGLTQIIDTQTWHLFRYGDDATGFGDSSIKIAFVGGDLANLASSFNTNIQNHITSVNTL